MEPVTPDLKPASDVEDLNSFSEVQDVFLPKENTLPMVPQRLRTPVEHAAQMTPIKTTLRRCYVLLGTFAMTIGGGYEMYDVLRVGGVTTLEAIVLFLFVLLFAWAAFSFMSALAGFVVLLTRRRDHLDIEPKAQLPRITSKNALLLPTYN